MAIAAVGSVSRTENASGTSLAITTVTGGSTGDILVATIGVSSTAGSITPPAGWTLIPNTNNPDAYNKVAGYYRITTGSESASYTWTTPSGQSTGFMRRYSGVDTTTPFDTAGNYWINSTRTTFPAPSVSSTLAGGMLLSGIKVNAVTAVDFASAPTGMTIPSNARSTGTGRRTAFAEQLLGAAGGTGTKTWTTTAAVSGATWIVAMRPASPGAVAAPTANAGADASGNAGTAFTRTATETGSSISARAWTIVSGPSGAGSTIGTAAALSWTPPVAGTYVLRYSVTNPGGTGTDDMTLTVGTPTPGSTLDVTATVEAGNVPPRVRLDVVDSSAIPYFSATVVRLNPDGTTSVVRTPDGNPLVLTTSGATRVGLVYDYEMPYGAAVQYSTVEAPWSSSAQVTVPETRIWLIHPSVPALSIPVEVAEVGSRERAGNRAIFRPMGRKYPVVFTDGARQEPESVITLRTRTLDELADVQTLLADMSPLLLNIPPIFAWGIPTSYIAVGDVTEDALIDYAGDPNRYVVLPYVVVEMPVGGSQAERSYVDLLVYSSYADLMPAYPTYLGVLSGP